MDSLVITVGKHFPREVTEEDHLLYEEMKKVLEASATKASNPSNYHYGLYELGDLATYLTTKYTLTKRP